MSRFSALAAERPGLAQVFGQHWETPLAQYGRALIDLGPVPLPQAFLDLVAAQATEGGWGEALAQETAGQLAELPWLQCAHHTTPTHGPTFSTIDLISRSALGPGRIYPIAAASGVAFSNSAWSGALSYGHLPLEEVLEPSGPDFKRARTAAAERAAHGDGEQRLSLIPAKMRDQLVFGSGLPPDFAARLSALRPQASGALAQPRPGEQWAQWAARSAARLGERVFGGQWIILDLNRLAARWIAARLRAGERLYLDLFRSGWSGAELEFLGHRPGKKSAKVLACRYGGGVLRDAKGGERPLSLEELAAALDADQLAPGVWLCFFALRFELGLHCLGSFAQADYLPRYARGLAQSPFAGALQLDEPAAPILTTGRVEVDGDLLWVLDRALEGRPLDPADFAQWPMKRFWEPIARQLGA